MVSLSECRDVDEVLNEMTLQEKLCLLTGGSGFGTRAIPRLGIPAAMMVDSAAGINLAQYYGDLYSRYQIRENLPFKLSTPTGKCHFSPGWDVIFWRSACDGYAALITRYLSA